MNRIPVYELLEQRTVADDAGGGAAESANAPSVYRPLTGDECTVTLYRVQISPPPAKADDAQLISDGYGDYACSAWFGEAAVAVAGDQTTTVRLRLGEADCTVDRGLETVLRGMTPGECREFCVGDGHGGRVLGRVTLTAVRKAAGRADDRLKMLEAAQHKAAGNRLYGAGRHADAFHRFSRAARAVLMLRDAAGATGRDALFAAVCNNMAACQLRAGNHEHAHSLAGKALHVDPDNVKALVRRCSAAIGLRMWDAALADATSALDRDPCNAVARRHADAANRGVREQQANYANMVKKMFTT